MKKTLTLAAVVALSLPLAAGVLPANAATTSAVTTTASNTSTSRTYTIVGTPTTYKTAKTYHTGAAKVAVNKGVIAADQPTIELTANGSLKAKSNYKVTKALTVKAGSKKVSYSYVSGHGWVLTSALKAGKLSTAKSVTYTVSNAKTFSAKNYYTKSAKTVVYKAAVAADQPKMTLTAKGKLVANKTYKVTRSATLKNGSKKASYSYVKGQGWVKTSALTAGKATAKKVTSTTYTVSNAKTFAAKNYYTKSAKTVVYKAAIAADQPKMTLTAKGKLTANKTYKVTRQATLTNKSKKHVYSYINGQGWVLKSALTAGKAAK
ncbi:hypothetical protein [Lactiplantibacillus daowaiensis]|uniref:Extracellular protein n=1 Tax=Lactiplantibacillus daowaiensis TaxID=2559918 RepID=A0ABW1RXR4_9LACO|nr:hypothetical protein [Lactiplantibacillus daowaiensis]